MWSMSSIMYSSETSHKSSSASLFMQESYNIVKREFCMAGFSTPPLTWAVFTPQKLSPVHCWRASSGGKYTLPCQSEGWEEQLGCPHKSPWGVCSVFGLWGAMQWILLSGWFKSTDLHLGFYKLRLHGVLPAWGIDFDLAGYGKPSQAHM